MSNKVAKTVSVIGGGIVASGPAPSAEALAGGVVPPPPDVGFVIDIANEFLIDGSGNRLIYGG